MGPVRALIDGLDAVRISRSRRLRDEAAVRPAVRERDHAPRVVEHRTHNFDVTGGVVAPPSDCGV